MQRNELVRYLDTYLRIAEVADYGPQGLQVEGAEEVTRVAFAVDSGLPCIDAAIRMGAQMLIVHHGLFWEKVEPIRGPLARSVRRLIQSNLNLYSAHLPLDAHPEVGNNVELARLLGLTVDGWFANAKGTDIGVTCTVEDGRDLATLVTSLEAQLNTKVRVLAHGPAQPQRVGIVSGFGIRYVDEAAALGLDTFITGETSHAHFYKALEHRMNVVFAGHYASETVGLKALGRHLNGRLGVETLFIDLPTEM